MRTVMSASPLVLHRRNIFDSNNVNTHSSIVFIISDSTTSSILISDPSVRRSKEPVAPFNGQFYSEFRFAADCGRFRIPVFELIGLQLRNEKKPVDTRPNILKVCFWLKTYRYSNRAMRTLSVVYSPWIRISLDDGLVILRHRDGLGAVCTPEPNGPCWSGSGVDRMIIGLEQAAEGFQVRRYTNSTGPHEVTRYLWG